MAFVIVSGYDDFAYCREALRLQITDYILKPVNYEEFGNCIDHLKISLYEQQTLEDSDLFDCRNSSGWNKNNKKSSVQTATPDIYNRRNVRRRNSLQSRRNLSCAQRNSFFRRSCSDGFVILRYR